MNLKASIAAALLGLIAGVGCGSETPKAAPPIVNSAPMVEKTSLTVDDVDPVACEAYAAKQSRLNTGDPVWTFRMDGTTCVVTQG